MDKIKFTDEKKISIGSPSTSIYFDGALYITIDNIEVIKSPHGILVFEYPDAITGDLYGFKESLAGVGFKKGQLRIPRKDFEGRINTLYITLEQTRNNQEIEASISYTGWGKEDNSK